MVVVRGGKYPDCFVLQDPEGGQYRFVPRPAPSRGHLARSRSSPAPHAGSTSHSPSASSPDDASRSGSSSWTATPSPEPSKRSAATTSNWPSTRWERRGGRQRSGHTGSRPSPRSPSSVCFRTADERMGLGPLPRLGVHPFDVLLELHAVDPPHTPPAELDGRKVATAD